MGDSSHSAHARRARLVSRAAWALFVVAVLVSGTLSVGRFVALAEADENLSVLRDEMGTAAEVALAADKEHESALRTLRQAVANRDEYKRLADQASVTALASLGFSPQAVIDDLYTQESEAFAKWMDSLEAVDSAQAAADTTQSDAAAARAALADRQTYALAGRLAADAARGALVWTAVISGVVVFALLVIAAGFWMVSSRAAAYETAPAVVSG